MQEIPSFKNTTGQIGQGIRVIAGCSSSVERSVWDREAVGSCYHPDMGYKNKDDKRAYQAEWVARRRLAWLVENGPCFRCGSNKELEVHHLDPSTKEANPTHLWSLSPNNIKRVAELAKCVVACYTCHKELTRFLFEVVEHGNTTMYRKGCRCVKCRRAATIDRRRYR